MSKKLFLVCLMALTFSFNAKAQYVTIPDTNFVNWLQTNYPSCMMGNQMDTTCIQILNEWLVDVQWLNIHDLTGIQYFDNLEELYCDYNQLSSLPNLPKTLYILWCDGNQLTNLPALPNTLIELGCDYNNLTILPTLPASLIFLAAIYNQLTTLPALPPSLEVLWCDGNYLTTLPTLPNSLLEFDCPDNQLNNLPELPNSLNKLNCSYNNISCFPVFPLSLTNSVVIHNNPFTCLPNYVTGMDAAALAYPLCTDNDPIHNPHACSHAMGVTGNIYKDNNTNCLMGAGDLGCNNVHVKLYDNLNNLISQTYSLPNGIYNFADSAGTYRVELDTTGVPYLSQCTSPGIDSVFTLTTLVPLAKGINFDIACQPGFDVGVQSVVPYGVAFPGLQYHLGMVAGDMSNWNNLHCAAGISGQIQLTVNGPVLFNNVFPGTIIPLVSGNVFTYNISDFGLVDNLHDFGLLFTIDTNAQIGDSICVNVVVTPTIGDNNPGNNTYHYCYQVSNSYDPNMKEVYPVNVPVGFNDYFTYTIHFQNTGNAPAINIRLVDTISNNLDLETFELINYSHYNVTILNGNVLTVRFPNIQLPDSATDQEGSKGFVQYRIKPKANWAIGTQIKNTAWIYFDYNAPIATNTTINQYDLTIGINENEDETTNLKIYPNPFNADATVQFDKIVSDATLIIYDLLGQKLQAIDHISGDKVVINRGNISNGIYFIRLIQDNKIVAAGKIIISG